MSSDGTATAGETKENAEATRGGAGEPTSDDAITSSTTSTSTSTTLLPPLLPPPPEDLPPVPSLRPASLADFDVVGRLGGGSFSDVLAARPLRSWPGVWESDGDGAAIALKVVDKHLLLRDGSRNGGGASAALSERATLSALRGCYGVSNLLFTFQDESSLFFGLELVPGGELFDQIQEANRRRRKKEEMEEEGSENDEAKGGEEEETRSTAATTTVLPLRAVRSYAAQLVLILRSLRSRSVSHRDLKPENLLLDGTGRLKLVDFGCATFFAPTDDDDDVEDKGEEDNDDDSPSASSEDEGDDLPKTSEEAAARALKRNDRRRRREEEASQQRREHPLSRSRRAGAAAAEFVGTADYLPPEALGAGASSSSDDDENEAEKRKEKKRRRSKRLNHALRSGACPSRDLWALGCVLFQMILGVPPFRAASEYLTYQRISAREFSREWPRGLSSERSDDVDDKGDEKGEENIGRRRQPLLSRARDLVERLLDPDPHARPGASSLEELARHPFFSGVDWSAVAERRERDVPEPLVVSPDPSSPSPTAAAGEAGGAGIELDWELLSIAAAGAPPLRYEHESDGANIVVGGGDNGGGVVLGEGIHALSAASFSASSFSERKQNEKN